LASQLARPLTDAAQELIEVRLQAGALVRFHVFTTSMLPTLRPGDTLLVRRASLAEIAPGALLVIRQGSAWIVHRLLRQLSFKDDLYLRTKGDNRLLADPLFDASQLIGVVQSIYRGSHKISLYTWRARVGGRLLAWLSWMQAKLYQPAPGLFHKIILQGLHGGIYILARLVYKP
jgi:hypothetical protein